MTPEEKRRGAFEEFDALLAKEASVDEAIVLAAQNNGLRPDNFREVAEKALGNLQNHAKKVQLRALNEAIAAEVKLLSSKRRPGHALDDCYDPDEVAANVEIRLGRKLRDDEFGKIHEARRDYVYRGIRELQERLG